MGALPLLQPCPCGRLGPAQKPLALGDCCGPFLADRSAPPAPDAQSLMRSRYTAFVLQRADYLLATWHATTRPSRVNFDQGVKWLGLEVRQHRPVDAHHAAVEFVARQKSPGVPAVRLHERSRFVREVSASGRWYYVGGDHL